jgi:hypothetical protein
MTKIKNIPMDFPDLKTSQAADGFIDLEQDIGCGESHAVRLHPLQVRFLAELIGLMPSIDGDEQAAQKKLAVIEKRLALVKSRIRDAHEWWDALPDDTPSGMEGLAHLIGLRDLVNICAEDADTAQAPRESDATPVERPLKDRSSAPVDLFDAPTT